MTPYLVAIILAVPGLLAVLVSWRVKRDVREVHLSLNSRLDKFVSMAEDVARAEGRDSERTSPTVLITTTTPPIVAGRGVEPRPAGSEPAVLPLDDPA